MRNASALNYFNPPAPGDTIQFPSGEVWEVYQDGMNWCLTTPGSRWRGVDQAFGRHASMVEFLRAINDKVQGGVS